MSVFLSSVTVKNFLSQKKYIQKKMAFSSKAVMTEVEI